MAFYVTWLTSIMSGGGKFVLNSSSRSLTTKAMYRYNHEYTPRTDSSTILLTLATVRPGGHLPAFISFFTPHCMVWSQASSNSPSAWKENSAIGRTVGSALAVTWPHNERYRLLKHGKPSFMRHHQCQSWTYPVSLLSAC